MGVSNPVFALIHVLPEKMNDFLTAPKPVFLKIGEQVEGQVILVKDTFKLFHLQEIGKAFCDLNLKVEMDDGGTGLYCLNKSVPLSMIPVESGTKQGFMVFLGKANAVGTARMRLYVEHRGTDFIPNH